MMIFIAGLGLIALLVELYYIIRPFSAVMRRNKEEKRNNVLYSDAVPSVSVIVVTRNTGQQLKDYLPLVLEQEYPKFEVILVDEGSWDETEDVVREFQQTYGDLLYYTKLPKESRVVSTKKLAITVGVKAAHNDVLLFTEPGTRPFSMYWIERMVRNFITGTEYILGLNLYNDNGKFVQHMIAYDTLLNNLKSLGCALIEKPYNGSGKNLAYLKSSFFNNNGYAGLLHMADGEDSMMINSHSTKINTRVECSRAGHTMDMDSLLYREWRYLKLREMIVEEEFTPNSKARLLTEPIARFLFICLSILCLVLLPIQQPSWWIYGVTATGCALVLKYILQIWVINHTLKVYNQPKFWLSPILYDIYLPMAKVFIYLFVKIKKSI